MKDFDTWNTKKKILNDKLIPEDFFFHSREIWWYGAGINVGVEIDGKNSNFERPILILKKFNKDMVWGLSLTTKEKINNPFYYKLTNIEIESWVVLSQIKTISTKRLLRRIGMISEIDFVNIKKEIWDLLQQIENPSIDGFSRRPKPLI